MESEAALVIFDRDGTIIGDYRDFLANAPRKLADLPPDRQEIVEEVKDFIAIAAGEGARIAIASNQGGVNPTDGTVPYVTRDHVDAQMRYLMQEMPDISVAAYCPDTTGQMCFAVRASGERLDLHEDEAYAEHIGRFRKPDPGMLQALRRHIENETGIAFADAHCFYVGDHDGVNQPKFRKGQDGALIEILPDDKDIKASQEAGFNFVPVASVIGAVREGEFSRRDFHEIMSELTVRGEHCPLEDKPVFGSYTRAASERSARQPEAPEL
jgi:HAD superfamily hydrolase (TIGR01662 family)